MGSLIMLVLSSLIFYTIKVLTNNTANTYLQYATEINPNAPEAPKITEIERIALTRDFARMKRYIKTHKHIPVLFRKARYV